MYTLPLSGDEEGDAAVTTHEDEEEGLYAVYDEGEHDGLGLSYSVEYQDGLDGEVPGAGAVGGGYDNGNGAYHKADQSCHPTQVLGEAEGVEGEKEMEEVAYPDANGVEPIEGGGANVLYGVHAGEHLQKGVLDARYQFEAVGDASDKEEDNDQAHKCDEVAGMREASQEAAHIDTGFLEEVEEHRHLAKQGDACDEKHQKGVNHTFRNHGTETLGKRGAVVATQESAAHHLADARYHQTDGIGDKDAMDATAAARMFVHGIERLFPAPSSHHLCQDAERQRQEHPLRVHVAPHGG